MIDEIAGEYYPSGAKWPNTEAGKLYRKFLPTDSPTQLLPQAKCQSPYKMDPKSNSEHQSQCDLQSQTKRDSKEPIPIWVHC